MSFIFPHDEVMNEEGMSTSSLPVDIRDMIEDFNELKAEYTQAPSPEGLDELKRESVKIADEIQDYLEETIEGSEEEEVPRSNYSSSNGSGKAKWRFW